MSKIKVFPKVVTQGEVKSTGIDLRDYFAGEALIAFMSNSVWIRGLDEECYQSRSNFKESMAIQCYVMADELLKARDIR